MVFTYFVIILLSFILFSVYILNLLSGYMYNQQKVEVFTKANIIASYASQMSFDKMNFQMDTLRSQLMISKNARIFILDGDAKVVFDSNFISNLKGKTMLDQQVLNALQNKNDYKKMKVEDSVVTVSAVPVVKDGVVKGVVCLRIPADDIAALLNNFRNNLILLSVILSLIIGLLSFVLANIITAPILELRNSLKQVAGGDLHRRLNVKAKGEIGELADNFNKMTNELQAQEEKRQEFVSNASHELKTPLSSIKLICDSLLQAPDAPKEMVDEFLNDMNNEVDRLTRIINRLLDLTKMDVEMERNKELFVTANLKDVIDGVIRSLQKLAGEKGITLRFETTNDVFMLMDEDKIWEAVYNIVDNSIKYTPQDGLIEVYLERDNTDAIITIKDNGIGIAKEEVSKIFDRFYRVDKARARATGGTGLGLSIALSAVELHDGHIEVQSEENQGSTFRIFLPIA